MCKDVYTESELLESLLSIEVSIYNIVYNIHNLMVSGYIIKNTKELNKLNIKKQYLTHKLINLNIIQNEYTICN